MFGNYIIDQGISDTAVVHLNGNNVMLAVGNGQRIAEIFFIDKVAQHKGGATLFYHVSLDYETSGKPVEPSSELGLLR